MYVAIRDKEVDDNPAVLSLDWKCNLWLYSNVIYTEISVNKVSY